MTSRADVVAAARTLIGTPWVHQGRTDKGTDCVGMIVLVRAMLALGDYDATGYAREPNPRVLINHLRKGGIQIPVGKAVAGDVMMFREGRFPCHLAILSEKSGVPHMIHCPRNRLLVEESLAHDFPSRRVAAFALMGVT
jgi:cell wall-associated NlpC family hydrolase